MFTNCAVYIYGMLSALCHIMFFWDVYRLCSIYGTLSALCYVMYLWGVYRLFSISRTLSALCYVMYLWGANRLFSIYRILSALCYVMFLWNIFRLFSIYRTWSALCYVMFFVEYFQIVQYLRDVVTTTQSMSTVNASITTMGYSSEGREINVIKVREPPRMNRSIFKHVIYNEKMENRPL